MLLAHSLQRVWMNCSALPLLKSGTGLLRSGLRSSALQIVPHGPDRWVESRFDKPRRQLSACFLHHPTALLKNPNVLAFCSSGSCSTVAKRVASHPSSRGSSRSR